MRFSDTALQVSPPAQWPKPASVQSHDIIWCKEPCEDAFLFTLDNAPYFLHETTHNIPPYKVNAALAYPALPDAFFLLTTFTCYHAPVAEWLSRALATHYRFSESLMMNIHTALHEAVTNAVIHGNLDIHGQFKCMKGFDAYYAHVHYRLNNPKYHFTHIAIAVIRRPSSIILCVSDEGEGYQGGRDCESSGVLPPGLGLSIIREQCSAVRVLQGGSAIEMEFAV
jgi:hypothetical protein